MRRVFKLLFRIAAWSLLVFFAAVGFLVVVLYTTQAAVEPTWCRPSEPCLREWMAALGGWVAAIAVLIAAGLVAGRLSKLTRATDGFGQKRADG